MKSCAWTLWRAMACRCGLDLHFVPDIVRCCHRGCSSHSCRCPARLQAPGHCKREHPMHPCSAFACKQGTDPTADGSPEVPMSVWWQAIQVGISAGGARRCPGAASPRKLCTGSAAIHTNFADAQFQLPLVCHLLLPLPSPSLYTVRVHRRQRAAGGGRLVGAVLLAGKP